MSGSRYSFHRPPGSVDEYRTNLVKLLEEVSGQPISESDLIDWMVGNLGNLRSRRSAGDKLNHFEHMGVITEISGEYELTDLGEEALDGDSREIFFNTLRETYIGFDEIIQAMAEGPQSRSEIKTILSQFSYHNWESSDQPKRRLDWLRSLDVVTEWDSNTSKFVLTETGSSLAREAGVLDYTIDRWGQDVYFISACNDDVRENFYRAVVEGINPKTIGLDYDADRIPIWGRKDTTLAADPSAGDWFVFYQNGRRSMFTYAARLREDPISDSDAGEWIWGGDYEYIYPLESLTPIDIDNVWLQREVRGYKIDHIQGMKGLGNGKCQGRYRLQYLYDSADDFVAAHARPDFENLREQLRTDGQVIMYGPPGTGKTYTAKQFADWWHAISPDRCSPDEMLESTTFHPAYSYEDFIEGLTANATSNGVSYEYKSGVFKSIVERIEENTQTPGERVPPYLLLIDEINRGNLPEILGELVTQLEWDKRGGQPGAVPANLAHSGESEPDFTVPSNLYLIGTMNTADQSITLIDAAIRRRFGFLQRDPDITFAANRMGYGSFTQSDESWKEDAQADLNESAPLARRLQAGTVLAVAKINRKLLEETNEARGKRIGHTYVLGKKRGEGNPDANSIRNLWLHKLFPLLEEFFYNDFRTLREVVFENTSELFDEQGFDSLTAEELATALRTYVQTKETQPTQED
jgi:5-methylcytosine-specific restriction protein B